MTPTQQILCLYQDQKHSISAAIGAILGCLLYFIMRTNFSVFLGSFSLFSLFLGCLLFYRQGVWFFAFGFIFIGISHLHTVLRVENSLDLQFSEGVYWVVGRVWEVTPSEERVKFILKDVDIFGSAAHFDQIQVSIQKSRWEKENLSVGDGVAAQVYLRTSQKPAFENDYDGRLGAFFQKSDGYGYVMGDFAETYKPIEYSFGLKAFLYKVEQWRYEIAHKTSSWASGVVSALLVGQRGYISDQVWKNFRDSGLAHLLAISGMHLGFMAGMVFFLCRWICCWIPFIALQYNIKKISAILGWTTALGYMLLAGSTIPTVRAFILISFIFLAVLLDRQKQLFRSISIAVLLVLSIWPWSVVTASFQLSFIVATGLAIWFYMYEWREKNRFRTVGVWRYANMVWLSSLIASLLILPLTVMHFSMISFAGIFANIIAVPWTAFIIMPLVFVHLLILPFGQIFIIDTMLLWSVDILVWWAGVWAAFPLSKIDIESGYFTIFLATCVLAVLVFLFQEQLKKAFLSSGMLLVGLLLFVFWGSQREDVYVLDSGQIVLQRDGDNAYNLAWPVEKLTSNQKYLLDRFSRRNRVDIKNEKIFCTVGGDSCALNVRGKTILITQDILPIEECYYVDYIISSVRQVLKPCDTKLLDIQESAKVFFQDKEGVFVQSFSASKDRPWAL